MDSTALDKRLKQVVRNHLTMSSQLFFHDLIARTWEAEDGTARDVYERYGTEYRPDISRLFALLEHMLIDGYSLRVETGDAYAAVVVRVGSSLPELLERDHELLAFGQTLMRSTVQLCEQRGDTLAAEILEEAIETRSELIDWIFNKQRSTALDNERLRLNMPVARPELEAWQRVNALVAQTLAAIDQTVCHTVVLAQLQDEEAALATWRRSWQTMVDLGRLVTQLARQRWAIDARADCRGDPSIDARMSDVPAETEALDAAAFARAAETAIAARTALADLDHEQLLGSVTALEGTLRACAQGSVPEAALAYSKLPQRMQKWSYATLS